MPLVTDLKKKQEIFQNNSSSYNGAIRDNYSWSQTIKDIDVRVKVILKIAINISVVSILNF